MQFFAIRSETLNNIRNCAKFRFKKCDLRSQPAQFFSKVPRVVIRIIYIYKNTLSVQKYYKRKK